MVHAAGQDVDHAAGQEFVATGQKVDQQQDMSWIMQQDMS
jgi:hypothetical protein